MFDNETIVVTGQEPIKVHEMMYMLAEMMGINEKSVEFFDNDHEGHYVMSPYSFQSNVAKKYIPPLHIDLGQGLLETLEAIAKEH
jgi:UDP-glucose 4-epimerase